MDISPFLYISKEQENAIFLFYNFLKYKGMDIDGDLLDEFYEYVFRKREESQLLLEMENLDVDLKK